MLARIYQIALANNEDYQIRRDFLESGAYDDLPVDLLEEKLETEDYFKGKTS